MPEAPATHVQHRTAIRLPVSIERLFDSALREQLRAIAARVRDVVATGIATARAMPEGSDRLAPVLAAHAEAMRIFESENAGYFHHVPGGLELQRSFACRAGCAFCCHLHVDVTPLEAVAVAAGLEESRRRAVQEAAPQVEGLDADARRAARLACPLLVEGQCVSYETRPAACRALYSTDARACEQVLLTPAGAPLPPIRSPAVPRALAETIAAGINAALTEAGLQAGLFELVQALTALGEPAAIERWLAGEQILSARR